MTTLQPVAISPVEDIVADIKAGRMVILVDEEDRENEGDLIMAADHVTADAVNFMARYGRGLICLTLTQERCERLQLPPMAVRNGDKKGTAFTVSIEAAEGVTTGISAADRARTVQAAVAKDAKPDDLVQPGHIFPLQAVNGGVLMVSGHVDGVGEVTRFEQVSESWLLQVLAPQALAKYLAYKGSITVNGVSLTVNSVQDLPTGCLVSINLIPHTIENTALGTLAAGKRVNLEIDLIARYVERMLGSQTAV